MPWDDICKTCINKSELISPAIDRICDNCTDGSLYKEGYVNMLERENKELKSKIALQENRYHKLIKAANMAMLEKMQENNHKSGWSNLRIDISLDLMRNEFCELFRVIYPADPINDKIDYKLARREAADVANYAAMIILKCDKEITKAAGHNNEITKR